MSERIADALVLAFSDGVSLKIWADTGLLEREWELYRRLAPSFGRIILVTYGKADDEPLAARLSPGALLVCNSRGLPSAEYIASIPARVAELAANCRSIVVKTNQMSGGEAAAGIALGMRRAGKHTALVARGGYLWSRFAAWESGPASRAAIDAGERESRLCRAADLVVATTREIADDLAWRYGIGEDRLAVVPNYILQGDAPSAVERDPNLVLLAGRLVHQKRADRLLDAVSRLPAEMRQTVTVSIIGGGPLESELKEQASRLGVRAVFEPRIPHEQLVDRMRRCGVYVQTSSYEGHPKTVIEAMSVGAPVLLASAPGLTGIVTHGLTGLCVSPEPESLALALEGLLAEPRWGLSLGHAAAEQARQAYGLDAIITLECAAYSRALSHAKSRAEGADHSRSVKWAPDLLETKVPAMVDAWTRSLQAFSQRLEPASRATFLAAIDAPIYNLQGQAAAEAEGGLHPKHRLMRYHDFFTDRITPGERVIDLGCGVGALAASIAETSRAVVTGMDWTPASLEKARKAAADRGLSRLSFTQGDITKDRAAGPFDVVVLSNVLEHITERPERLRVWREWYHPKRLLIRVPAFDREWRVPWKKELGVEWRLDVTHETEYTQGQLEDELKRAGLRAAEWVIRWGEYYVTAEPA